MKLNEVVKLARETNESAFGKVNDQRAVKILRAAFQQVKNQLETAEDGKVVIDGLGRFVIRNVQHEKDGVTVTKRKVVFRYGGADKTPKGEAKNPS